MKIFSETLILTILGCIVTGIFALFVDEASPQTFVYAAFMTFGSILIPTLLAVICFQALKKYITFADNAWTSLVQIATLLFILFIGLCIWASVDVIIDADRLTVRNVMRDFRSQFSGFVVSGICMAVALPYIDRIMTKERYLSK